MAGPRSPFSSTTGRKRLFALLDLLEEELPLERAAREFLPPLLLLGGQEFVQLRVAGLAKFGELLIAALSARCGDHLVNLLVIFALHLDGLLLLFLGLF